MRLRNTRPTNRWGYMERLTNPPALLLYNFDIGSAQLKLEHQQYLHDVAVPLIRWGNSVTIVGLASRTGSKIHNFALSLRRAERTLDFLHSEIRDAFNTRAVQGFGEMKAEAEGYRDNSEDPRFRSVVLMFAPGPTPPFPPALIDVTPTSVPSGIISEDSDVDIGKIIDVASGISQLLEQMPWETIATIGEYGDIATLVIGQVTMLPLLWSDVNKLNTANGTLQGFWEAMQQMSDRYADPGLSTTPLPQWPGLQEPAPRSFGIPSSEEVADQREWMNGRRAGCRAAYELIQVMERKPKLIKGWYITGRRQLFMLSQKFGSHVGDEFHRFFDSKLAKQNKSWPLT